jgi:hypothetical protein
VNTVLLFGARAMDDTDPADAQPARVSIARCRELLGDEADALSDHEVVLIRHHADAMAHALVEIFLENRTTPE